MRILVVGGGGREHALCWKIASSPLVTKLFCAPGNAGIAEVAQCVDLSAEDIPGLVEFARREDVDLTVVGPEAPLVAGIVDAFHAQKLKVFGPTRAAAQIEGDKAFCKKLLRDYRIPTAAYRTFESSSQAIAYVEGLRDYPVVVKAAGLAAGKGVMICRDVQEARAAVRRCMDDRAFGKAGDRIVVEDFLEGDEVSVLMITDGETIVPFETAEDYKAVFDDDQGPNTGGMGVVSPLDRIGPRTFYQIESQILVPAVHALNREGARFCGVLYAGLMMTQGGPRVLEFNARFGDPETQALLLRLKSDLVPFLQHAADGQLHRVTSIDWDPRPSLCVMAAAEGYPGEYAKGATIRNLGLIHTDDELQIFHSGTTRVGKDVVTSGGRVLAAVALGDDVEAAREKAYAVFDRVQFSGMHVRQDIGRRRRAGSPNAD